MVLIHEASKKEHHSRFADGFERLSRTRRNFRPLCDSRLTFFPDQPSSFDRLFSSQGHHGPCPTHLRASKLGVRPGGTLLDFSLKLQRSARRCKPPAFWTCGSATMICLIKLEPLAGEGNLIERKRFHQNKETAFPADSYPLANDLAQPHSRRSGAFQSSHKIRSQKYRPGYR